MNGTRASDVVGKIMKRWNWIHREKPWIQKTLVREMVNEAYLSGYNEGFNEGVSLEMPSHYRSAK